jgi:hypothetical protein
MKRISFLVLLSTICVMLNADAGEEMLKRAIITNPTNSWDKDKQKGQWTSAGNMSAYLFSSGSMYFGNFLGNNRQGYGIYMAPEGYDIGDCPNAKYYVGNWLNNKKSGTGTCYNASGIVIYDGEFKDNKPTGTYPMTGSLSLYKFQTIDITGGNKYIGETKDGKIHGYGVYAWKDGGIWIGHWKDGVRAGQGIYIASDGGLTTGYWDKDTRSSAPPTIASNSPSSNSSNSSSSSTYSMGGNEMTINPGYVTTTTTCAICSGTGFIQGLNSIYGMGRANSIRYGYSNTVPMYTSQICYLCNGAGKTTTTTYVDPNPSQSKSSSDYSTSPSSSGRTRTCDLCLGKAQLWEYTGSVGDPRTTIYCSVSGCDVKSPHRHTPCNRCGGTGTLSL